MSIIIYSSEFILLLKSKYNSEFKLKKFNVINPYLTRSYKTPVKYSLPKIGKNAWHRKESDNDIEQYEKKIKSILNKLTKEKFDKLSDDICNLAINNINFVYKMVDLIFNKAIELPTFSDLYVQLMNKVNLDWITKSNHYIYHYIYNYDDQKHYWTYHINSITDYTNGNLYGPFFTSEKILSFILKSNIKTLSTFQVTNIDILLLQIFSIYIKKNKIYTIYLDESSKKFFYKVDSLLFTQNNKVYTNNTNKMDTIKYACDSINFINLINDKSNKYFQDTLNDKNINLDIDDDEIVIKKKHLRLGNIYLIAELFKNNLLTDKDIYQNISILLNLYFDKSSNTILKVTNYDELPIVDNDIECVCKLLIEIGPIIDKFRLKDIKLDDSDKLNELSYIGQFIYYLKQLIDPDKQFVVTSRIRFMIKDLLECRNNKWIERTKKVRSSKLCKIR